MGIIEMESELLLQIAAGLIIALILGLFGYLRNLHACVSKQAHEMELMKKANTIVLGLFISQTRKLHPKESKDLDEIEKIYNEIIGKSHD